MKRPSEQRHVLWQALDTWGHHCSKSNLNEQVLQALRNVNFTKTFGFYVTQHLHAPFMSPEFALAMRKIQKFFSLIEILLQRLQFGFPHNISLMLLNQVVDRRILIYIST
ncbi:hypothetical protein MPER_08805 [Moniliophthora perniciosa FA553]|nr:hypothetical protein MPER_08805 [Moniliophthora perniciosa FA553]